MNESQRANGTQSACDSGPKTCSLMPLIGINVAQETTRSQALPGNALVWRLLPPEFTK
jgi:hypothetical protein